MEDEEMPASPSFLARLEPPSSGTKGTGTSSAKR